MKCECLHFNLQVSDELKEAEESNGSWESGIPYEARTLLFKAVNNLIERSLLSREFVRLGRWFVQPCDGGDKPAAHKASHLSFSFQYFVHGESAVCTSVDVRQHPAVRRLTHQHLATAASLASTVNVVLAPYGMAGTLTGNKVKRRRETCAELVIWRGRKKIIGLSYLLIYAVLGTSYPPTDPAVRRLLEDWRSFWPLAGSCYSCRDSTGDTTAMPGGVEVMVGGARLLYPTSYVLVTDIDPHLLCDTGPTERPVQPSPFTASGHELIPRGGCGGRTGDRVWGDAVLADPEPGDHPGDQTQLAAALASWDYVSPGKTFKRKHRRVKRESREVKVGRTSRAGVPVFKKGGEFGEPGLYSLDQDGFTAAAAQGRLPQHGSHHGSHGQPSRVPTEGLPLPSPASLGPATPGPFSVKSEAMALLSPHTGPATPAYTPHPATPTTPGGPKSTGPPGSVPSPYRALASAAARPEPGQPGPRVSPTAGRAAGEQAGLGTSGKRPALPAPEYEEVRDTLALQSAYDLTAMTAWLSHPVKKSRPADGRKPSPMRPMHRRRSQGNIFQAVEPDPRTVATARPAAGPDPARAPSGAPTSLTNGITESSTKPKSEFEDSKPAVVENLFDAESLKPSLTDLDNMFEDSDSEGGLGCVPTPPNSVKPSGLAGQEEDYNTKVRSKEPPGNCSDSQLQQMFPTPPSHEHPSIHSPMEQDLVQDIKQEPASPPRSGDVSSDVFHSASHLDCDDYFDHTLMLASSKFAPLPASSLPSSSLLPLPTPDTPLLFKPSYKAGSGGRVGVGVTSQLNPAPPLKPGMSPISPATSDANPRSNKSTNPPSVGGPRSVGGPNTPRGPVPPHTPLGSGQGGDSVPAPLLNSLTLNLVLSDSILNLFRDINFNSCTMCVCTNEGNIKGGEAVMYLPEFGKDDDYDCKCGYSAFTARRASHLAGMFVEDEREVTGLQEDPYYKKKLSLLLLDPKSQEQGEHRFNERAAIVDSVSGRMVELIAQQSGLFCSDYSSVIAYSNQHVRSLSRQQQPINIVEAADGTETVWAALETVRAGQAESGKSDLDPAGKSGCLHKWPIIPAAGPFCSEDIVRVMNCLLPVLNVSLHVRPGSEKGSLTVAGPLTWRQFHRYQQLVGGKGGLETLNLM